MSSVKHRILAINPGTTFTNIGVFEDEQNIFERKIRHDEDDLSGFHTIAEQLSFRTQLILDALVYEGINLSKLTAVCARGGLLRPLEGGTYLVNDQMVTDLLNGYNGEHPSNLGGLIGAQIAKRFQIPVFITDPVVVDELHPLARLSGFPEIPRKSIFHALNHKAAARKAAAEKNKRYEEAQLIVVHLGNGVTVGAHRYGKVIDVNNGLNGEGPYTAERAGTIPAGDLVKLCFSGRYNEQQLIEKLTFHSGFKGYLGDKRAEVMQHRLPEADKEMKLVFEGMVYQTAKEIGAMSTVLNGNIDAIAVTGNFAADEKFVKLLADKVSWIADVLVYPGENELRSLIEGALRVLRKEEQVKAYTI